MGNPEYMTSMVKRNKQGVTKPMISIVGHITADELVRMLDLVSMANGYANRFNFVCVHRSKELPFGGKLKPSAIEALGNEVRKRFLKWHLISKEITMDAAARKLWSKVYHELSTGLPGMLGAITGRAEAQTIRFALIYAVLDDSDQIREVHLQAALALWKYCQDSAQYIFGESVGDPFTDELFESLAQQWWHEPVGYYQSFPSASEQGQAQHCTCYAAAIGQGAM
jgi:Protein of unknown function (DUF3987)